MPFCTTLLLFCLSFPLFAQWGDEEIDERAAWRDRVFTGGGFGMSFSTNADFVSVSPLIGYRVSPNFAPGISVTYKYTNYKNVTPKITTNDYGIAPFARYKVTKNVFLQAEYEYLNYQFPVSSTESIRKSFSSFLAGGGFFQPVGRRASIYMIAMYNFSYRNPAGANTFQPYNSPIVFRAGITAGF